MQNLTDIAIFVKVVELSSFTAAAELWVHAKHAEPLYITCTADEEVGFNGARQVASESPLLLVQGGQDPIVVPARTAALFDRLCGLGQVVDQIDLPTANHDTEPTEAQDEIAAWIAARFAGEPALDDC